MNLIHFTLPASWANYLINKDATDLRPGEKNTIDTWLEDQGNPDIVDCGHEYFSRKNEANDRPGNVCDYGALI